MQTQDAKKTESNPKPMMELLRALYPLHRTINSDDFELSLKMIQDFLGGNLTIHSYEPGTPVYSWQVPSRYYVDEAYIECDGKRYAEFSKNSLHIVSYSVPVDEVVSYETLKEHVFTSTRQPNEIPWMFKYYDKTWGFCMRKTEWEKLDPNKKYRVVIRSRFEKKPFLIGEVVVPGKTQEEILWVSDICHPNQVNDSISGAVVAAQTIKDYLENYDGHYTLRFLFLAETIGSITWFAHNEGKLKNIRFGLYCEMLGKDDPFRLKLSRQGETSFDYAAQRVFSQYEKHGQTVVIPFKEMIPGNDEKVMNACGIDIPSVSFTRWPYPEYHTTADNPSIIKPENLSESKEAAQALIAEMNASRYPIYLSKGPIFLSGNGLWVYAHENEKLNKAIQKLLFLIDGQHSVRDIAEEVQVEEKVIEDYLNRFEAKGFIRWSPTPC